MSNFYGKRFLSSLLGALSVLSSPVASAVGGKLGKGNLKGKVGSSAGRSKNGGKGGKLEADRKVKSVNGLKEVLKETGGKVVRVSPDGKGGFVAFVKTPRGIVTVAIVGVPLLVIISYLFRRKNDGAGDRNPEIVVENASGGLLDSLFKDERDKYEPFVKKLLTGFFDDISGVLKGEFDSCKGDLDRFLVNVFEKSSFVDYVWQVKKVTSVAIVYWNRVETRLTSAFGQKKFGEFFESVFDYLSEKSFVVLPNGGGEARWGDKISAVLFGSWCLVKFNLNIENDAKDVKSKLEESKGVDFKEIFNIIKSYVEERLNAANKGYDGQEKS